MEKGRLEGRQDHLPFQSLLCTCPHHWARMNEKHGAFQRRPVYLGSDTRVLFGGSVSYPRTLEGGSLVFQSLHSQYSVFSPVVSDGLQVATIPGPVTLPQMLGLHVSGACGWAALGHSAKTIREGHHISSA